MRGYYGTSLRRIAKEARVTPSLLQKYFPTKELILEAFIENAAGEIDMFVTSAQKAIATTPDVTELLRKIAFRYIGFVERLRGFYVTWVTSPELVQSYIPALPHFVSVAHEILAGVLVDRLGIDRENALARVRIFLGALFAWVVYYNRVGVKVAPGESKEDRVERLVSVVLAK